MSDTAQDVTYRDYSAYQQVVWNNLTTNLLCSKRWDKQRSVFDFKPLVFGMNRHSWLCTSTRQVGYSDIWGWAKHTSESELKVDSLGTNNLEESTGRVDGWPSRNFLLLVAWFWKQLSLLLSPINRLTSLVHMCTPAWAPACSWCDAKSNWLKFVEVYCCFPSK